MRKITHDAATAFHKLLPFSRGNTKVVVYMDNVPTDMGANAEPSMVRMYLHGNCIAQRTALGTTISNCGWFTPTTKERLNGLFHVSLNQVKGEWILNGEVWDGEMIFVDKQGV